jgi:hypothetical protein
MNLNSLCRRLKDAAVTVHHKRPPQSSLLTVLLCLTYLLEFLGDHRRLPLKPHRLFNDFLFKLKAGSEMMTPLRKFVTDKEFSKTYIEKLCPGSVTPTTLAILRTPEEIDAYCPDIFPVVIKPTHSSGQVVIATSESDYLNSKALLKDWLKHDYFLITLERNYQHLDRKVMLESYIDDVFDMEGSVHCLWGEPKIISLIDRKTKQRQSFDTNRVPLGVSLAFPLTEFTPRSWRFFDALMVNSRTLSSEFNYIRIDFYTDGERIVFGELTNLPAGARGRFYPQGGEHIFSRAFFKALPK